MLSVTTLVTYTLPAANGCSAISSTTIVDINSTPSPTISYAGSPYCANAGTANVTLVGTTGGMYSSTTGLSIDPATGAIDLLETTPGTYVVTYFVSPDGGCSATTTANVTVAAAPTATISYAGTPYCASTATANVTFTGTTGGLYTAGAGLSINSTTGSLNLTASTPGTYTVTYTKAAANGCAVFTTSTSVTVTATPSATISYAGTTFCNTGTATVTRTGTAGGTYSSTTGLVIDATSGTINLAASTPGSYTVTYLVAAGGGCSVFSTTASLTISAAASANITYPATPYCTSAGTANVTRTGTAGGIYTAGTGLSINATTGGINLTASTPGNYTVTYTVAAANGCSLFATTAPVTVTAAPTATISYSSATFCNTGSATVTRTGSTGGTYSGPTGLVIDANTGTINLASSTVGSYIVTYTIAASGGCSSFSTTTNVTVAILGTWTGAVDTDWNKGANWSCNSVPSTTDNVTIPAGLSRYPVVALTTSGAKDFAIANGASITVTNALLRIGGNITGSGTINAATNGGIEFNGTVAQTIPATLFASATVNYLVVNNAVSVTLAGALNITDLITIKSGVLNTANLLTLKSTATTTARIGVITSLAATPINGTVTIERYVPGRRKYRLVTSSVTTSAANTLTAGQENLSIWGNWQNGGNNTIANSGTIITGGSTADGFDAQTSNPSLFTYDAVNRRFIAFSTLNGKNTKYTPLKAGVAYYMFVFGDRLNSIGASAPNSTILKQTGTVLTGDQLYNTTTAIPLMNEVGKFTLLGNPYACTIDWKSVQKSRVSNTIWGWDANLSSTGGYVTVTATTSGSLISPLSTLTRVNRYVQPGQGFFVQTTALNPSIIISEYSKVEDKANVENLVFRENQEDLQPLMAINLLYDKGEDKVLADGAVAAFDDTFENGVGEEDGVKLFNSTESVSIKTDTSFLSISARKMPVPTNSLALNFQKLSKSKYTLQIFANNMQSSLVVPYLHDNYLRTEQLLSLTDTNHVDFYVVTSEAASYDANRFKIVFKASGTLPVSFVSVSASKIEKHTLVEWKVGVQTNVKSYAVEKSIDGVYFSKQYEVAAGNRLSYSWLDVNMGSGTTYYRIRAIENDGKYLTSHIVSVKFDKAASSIRVFPNPVKGQSIHIYLKQIEKGDYAYSITNAGGKEVFSKKSANNGGSSSEILNLYQKLPQGIYFLKITGKNSEYSEKIIVD